MLEARFGVLVFPPGHVLEIMRQLDAVHIAQGLARRQRKLRLDEVAETAGGGDSLTRQPAVFQDLQGVGEVLRQLVDRFLFLRPGVFHRRGVDRLEGAAGFQVDDPVVGDHHLLNGTLDDVYIYDRALSPAEVATLFAVPEPSTALLLGIGLAGLGMRTRRGCC